MLHRAERMGPAKARTRPRLGWWVPVSAGVAILALGYYFAAGPVLQIRRDAPKLKAAAGALAAAVHARHYRTALADWPRLARLTSELDGPIDRVGYLGLVPGLGREYRAVRSLMDAASALTGATMPLWERVDPLLGGSQGRLRAGPVLAALPSLWPRVRAALPSLRAGERDLAGVDFSALPASLARLGRLQRERGPMARAIDRLSFLADHGGAVDAMLGIGHPVKYLLVLENAGELRASGGFITAYGILTVRRGLPRHSSVHAIAKLQKVVRWHPAPPWLIHKFWPKLHWWGVRDAGLSPNIPTTARVVERFYDSVPHHQQVAGVIFVDSWLGDSLLAKSGGVTLGAHYDNVHLTGANANLKMEYLAERLGVSAAHKKAFLGTLVRDLRHRFLGAKGHDLLTMVRTLQEGTVDGHLAVYFNSPGLERLAEHWGWAGTVIRHPGGDYLQVVNDNLGGHKDNFYLETHVVTSLKPVGRRTQETTQITWTMPKVAGGWLVVPYYGWVNVYVPYGSRLISARNSGQDGPHVVQDRHLEKTVFGMRLNIAGRPSPSAPPTTAEETLVYDLPAGVPTSRLVVQKQPGMEGQALTVIAGGHAVSYFQTRTMTISLTGGR